MIFDVANWVSCLNKEDGSREAPSYEALRRYPQSLDSLLIWLETISAHLDWWQNPTNVMKGADLHPQAHSIQIFTDALNEGWGTHLDQVSAKELWSDREKRLHINGLQVKEVSLALKKFKDQCQSQTVLVVTDSSTVVAYINKQGGTHLAEMCALLWKMMTWYHNYKITLRTRHIPGCLNVMADLLSRSNQCQSSEWSLHPQLLKQICQNWFTPHVNLFATHLNHKVPLYMSPFPDQHAWDRDVLNKNLGDPKNQATQLPDLSNSPWLARDVRVSGPSTALNRDPTPFTSVNKSSQTISHSSVPQQSTTAEPPCPVSKSGQLQEQGFSVEVAERIAAPKRSSTRTIYQSKWALFEK